MKSVRIAVLFAILSVSATASRAELDGKSFSSKEWRVSLEAPDYWNATDKTAYPNILLRLYRRAPDGKMLLAVEKVKRDTKAVDYAVATAERLNSMGFQTRAPQLHTATGAYLVDAQSRTAFLRQAYLVSGGVAYSLTLAATDSRTRSSHLRAFERTLKQIKVTKETKAKPVSGNRVVP